MPKFIFASTRDSDMRYAVNISITTPFFYLETSGKKYAFLGKRDFELTKAQPSASRRLSPWIIPLEPFAEKAKKLSYHTNNRNKIAYLILKKHKLLGRKIEVPVHFPLDMADFLRAKGFKLVPTFPFFPQRAIKTTQEIDCIKECLTQTKSVFRIIETILQKSKIRKNRIYYRNKVLTSEFLKQEAEKALIERGISDSLGMIISTGKQTAIPHHTGTGPILPHQPIVCDIFPQHRQSGYFADMTRTYVKGRPSPEIRRMYSAVLKIQKTIMRKIRSGIPAKNVQDFAAEITLKLGFEIGEKGLIHGLGHGIGLDIHEKPSLKLDSEDILEAGNVITVEPGLYYPKIGGVRIEDIILVTKTGYKNLTNYPKRLIIP